MNSKWILLDGKLGLFCVIDDRIKVRENKWVVNETNCFLVGVLIRSFFVLKTVPNFRNEAFFLSNKRRYTQQLQQKKKLMENYCILSYQDIRSYTQECHMVLFFIFWFLFQAKKRKQEHPRLTFVRAMLRARLKK